jgi:hypothetical protein
MSALVGVRPRETASTLAVSCALTVGLLVLFLRGSETTRLGVLVAITVAVAAWVTAVHPVMIVRGFVFVLAVVPYFHVPGTGIPLLLVLALGVWVAMLFLPGLDFRPGWPEALLAVLAAVAVLSVVTTGVSVDAFIEYAAWLAATAVLVPLRFLPDAARRACIHTFVLGCAIAAVIGIVLLRIDPQGVQLTRLTFAGYDPLGDNAQLVPGTETNTLRLTGTYVEPNIAGLILAVGVLLAVAYTRGLSRVALTGLIGTALLLTLSRSALGTVAVAFFLLVLLAGGRRRLPLLVAGLVAALGALSIPVVRDRLLNSFGPSDTGSMVRSLAFQDFPEKMEGHWLWGLGWAREEFRDPVVGRIVNFVANAPLLTIYRGGVVVGGVVVLLLIVLTVRSVSAARRDFPEAVLACGVIAFCLVALQLDFPAVIQPPATAVFSLLVGLSVQARLPARPAPNRVQGSPTTDTAANERV